MISLSDRQRKRRRVLPVGNGESKVAVAGDSVALGTSGHHGSILLDGGYCWKRREEDTQAIVRCCLCRFASKYW